MDKAQKRVSHEVGLEIGAICGKYFLKSQHLHYGYWTSDLEVNIANLHIAQDNYTEFLVSHIPDGVKTILDVGCGFGETTKKLIDMGYQVDCVSPSPFLSKQARELLGNTSHIFECFYEQLQTENRYDLILFSESFQYIDPEEAIKKTLSFLNQGGYLLICDFFKKDTPCKSLLSGGHPLTKFYNIISEYPLEPVTDLDITKQTAPNLDIANNMLKEVIQPTVTLAQQLLHDRYPLMSKFVEWMYRKKIDKINRKYFDGEKTGENFRKFKSYRLLLYKKLDSTKVWQVDFTEAYPQTIRSKSGEKIRVGALRNLIGSNKRLDYILRQLRRWRTLAIWTVFLILIAENILTAKKPNELLPPEVSTIAIIGVVLILSGGFLRCWAGGYSAKRSLCTTGPYAIVRHPLYLGSLLVICGILLQLNDLMNWVVVLPLFTIFYGAAIIYEERLLEKKFARQWQLYKAKVPVIIPSLRNWSLTTQTRKWNWKVCLSTRESWITLVLLSLPLLIELIIEDFVFESLLGV